MNREKQDIEKARGALSKGGGPMSKPKNAAVRARMLRRVKDVYHGAGIVCFNRDENDEDWAIPSVVEMRGLISGISQAFDIPTEGDSWLTYCWNLERFKSPETLTDFMIENGVSTTGAAQTGRRSRIPRSPR